MGIKRRYTDRITNHYRQPQILYIFPFSLVTMIFNLLISLVIQVSAEVDNSEVTVREGRKKKRNVSISDSLITET